jgi:hypothetical protein
MSAFSERVEDRRIRSAVNYGRALGLLRLLESKMTYEQRKEYEEILKESNDISSEIFTDKPEEE